MFDAYVSQRDVLAQFPREHEAFRVAPDVDFTHPPHEGKVWYEHLGWPTTAAEWRQQITAVAEAPR